MSTPVRTRLYLACCFLLVLGACSGSAGNRSALQNSAAGRGDPVVEVETPQDQALHEIIATPREFTLDFGDAHYAWERARMFMDTYTDGGFLKMAAAGDTQYGSDYASLTNVRGGTNGRLGSKDTFIYEIKKIPTRGGYRFSVSCVPFSATGDKTIAKRNAMNVARFLKSGELEASLLVR